MTMASRMSSGPLSARNGAKAGEILVSLVIVVDKYVFSIRSILVVVQKSCGRRDNDTPMPYSICHMKYGIWNMKISCYGANEFLLCRRRRALERILATNE